MAIGIGASGPVDAAGVIRNPDTLPAFTGLPVLEMFDGLTDELDRLVPWAPRTPVVASTLDDFGGAVGAAVLARANL